MIMSTILMQRCDSDLVDKRASNLHLIFRTIIKLIQSLSWKDIAMHAKHLVQILHSATLNFDLKRTSRTIFI